MDSHARAEHGVNKVLQAFFILFVLAIVVIFIQKILTHTDGNIVTVDENNPACWDSTQEIMDQSGLKAVKCK